MQYGRVRVTDGAVFSTFYLYVFLMWFITKDDLFGQIVNLNEIYVYNI